MARSKKAKPAPPETAGPTLREPTPAEVAAIARARKSREKRPARVTIVAETNDGVLRLSNPHTDGHGWSAHMNEAFGTRSGDFSDRAFARLANATGDRTTPVNEADMNAVLAVMGAIEPQNELEAIIGEQIIATHVASMDFLRRARMNAGEYRDSAAAYTNMATKVSRTMATHIEALSKLRSGGKQQVEVRYVYVNGPAVIGDGAQAVFGGVHAQGRGGESAKPPQPHEYAALAHSPGAPVPQVWGQEPSGLAVSGAGFAGEATLQTPRWTQPGRAEGEGERAVRPRSEDAGVEGSPGASPLGCGDAEG